MKYFRIIPIFLLGFALIALAQTPTQDLQAQVTKLQVSVSGLIAAIPQPLTAGSSGALTIQNGTVDIVSSVMPTKMSANVWPNRNTFGQGVTLSGGPQPACDASWRGTVWFLNGGSAKDSVDVCVWTGSAFGWQAIY